MVNDHADSESKRFDDENKDLMDMVNKGGR